MGINLVERNGRWVVEGALNGTEAEPLISDEQRERDEKEARDRIRKTGTEAVLNGKKVVWAGENYGWQSPESFRKAKSEGKLEPKPEPPGVLQRFGQQLIKPFTDVAQGSIPRVLRGEMSVGEALVNEGKWGLKTAGNVIRDRVVSQAVPTPLTPPGLGVLPKTQFERNVQAAASAGVLDNAVKAIESGALRLTGQPDVPGQSAGMRRVIEASYRVLGAKPPSEMTQGEAELDSTLRSLSLSTSAAVGIGMAGGAVGVGVGTTTAGRAVRGLGLFAAEEGATTLLDDNRGGNAMNLVEALGGLLGQKWDLRSLGATRPTDTWGEATQRSVLPNAALAGLLGLATGGASGVLQRPRLNQAVDAVPTSGSQAADGAPAPDARAADAAAEVQAPADRAVEITDPLPSDATKRALNEHRTVWEIQGARRWAEERGLVVPIEDDIAVVRKSEPQITTEAQRQQKAAVMREEAARLEQEFASEAEPRSQSDVADGEPVPASTPQLIDGLSEGQRARYQAMSPDQREGLKSLAERMRLDDQQAEQLRARLDGDPAVAEVRRLNEDTWARSTLEWLKENEGRRTVASTPMEMGGAVRGELPDASQVDVTADPWVDPSDFNPFANAGAIEADQFVRDLNELDDAALRQIAESPSGQSIVGQVQSQLEIQDGSRPAFDPRFGDGSVELAFAPGKALGYEEGTWLEAYTIRLQQLELDELRSLTDGANNPFAARYIETKIGRPQVSARRQDMIEALTTQAAQRDEFVVPRSYAEDSRPGQMTVALSDVELEPRRFQFRQNIDPETGVDPDRSLADQQFWDPELEGEIVVWPSEDGGYRLVDGHSRVEAARRLGIRSLPAREANAANAVGAKAIGAIKNIAEGSAAPIEVADFLRGSELRSIAAIRATAPELITENNLELLADGLSLNRLPDSLRNAVKSGSIPDARGAVIGASGRSPEEMVRINAFAVSRKVSPAELREMLALTGEGGLGDLRAPGRQLLWDFLLTDDPAAAVMLERLQNRARLWSRVRSKIGADQELYSQLADGIGASRPVLVFDRLKTQQGPVAQMLLIGADQLPARGVDELAEEIAAQITARMKVGEMATAERAAAAANPPVEMPSPEELQQANAAALTKGKRNTRTNFIKQAEARQAAGEQLSDADAKKLEKYRGELEADRMAQEVLDRQKQAEKAGAEAARAARTEVELEPPSGPLRLSSQERDALRVQLMQRAIDGDEVRNVTTPLPEVMSGLPGVDGTTAAEVFYREGLRPGNAASQALADEIRLATEQAYTDQVRLKASQEAVRESKGYYRMSLRERIRSGEFTEGFEDEATKQQAKGQQVLIPEAAVQSMPKSSKSGQLLVDNMAKQLEDWIGLPMEDGKAAIAAKGQVLLVDKLPGTSFVDAAKAKRDGLQTDDTRAIEVALRQFYGIGPEGYVPAVRMKPSAAGLVPETDVASPMPSAMSALDRGRRVELANNFTLPDELMRSAPRWGRFELTFESDLDRAAYILSADKQKGESRSAAKFNQALRGQGLDPEGVAAYGRNVVRPQIQAAASGAGDEVQRLQIPRQQFGGDGALPSPAERKTWINTRKAKADKVAGQRAQLEQLKAQRNSGGCN